MRPLDYLLDRLPLILGFSAALIFLLLVVHLAVAPLRLVDAAYILLLGAVSASVCLVVDHQRQRAFRLSVARRLARGPSAGEERAGNERAFELVQLPPAKSREQRALAELLANSQRDALEALQRHRRSAEEHRAFVDLWVHHMKTPLSVLELTVQQREPQGEWRSVGEEVDELGRGLDLMLTASRLERFELDLNPVRVDLVDVVRASVNELRRAWIRSGVFPSVEAPRGTVEVETDPKWLQVVLRQLLTNAMKYSEAGQKARVVVGASQDGAASVSVVDEGIGIPPEDLPRVFDRFFTGANGRRTKASTGMGLFLAAEVCRRLGHELTVESRVGDGSAFTVELRPEGLHRLR